MILICNFDYRIKKYMKNLIFLVVLHLISFGYSQNSANGLTDINGNKYKTLLIEDVEWMTENLNVSMFKNGDPILEAKTSQNWTDAFNNGVPCWCYYNFDSNNEKKYGKLYNWHAVNDTRGLAPDGWIIPTFFYWLNLPRECGGIKVEEMPQLFYAKNFDEKFQTQKGGHCTEEGTFSELNNGDYFWMADNEGKQWFANFNNESTKNDFFENPNVDFYNINIYFIVGPAAGASVRCIKE